MKEVAMPLRQDFAEQVKAQTEVWRAQIKDYQEKMESAGAKAVDDYKKAIAQMQAKADEARKLAEQVQGANENAWKDMQNATSKALAELQKGWADAVSRFR
jgi:cell division septum initiation protein DivIVA